MGTFDVGFPANKKVKFPNVCVSCQKPDPGNAISLSFLGSKTTSLLESVTDGALGGPSGSAASNNTSHHVAGIPACKSCEFNLKWYHRLLKFAMYTAWIPGVLLILLNKNPVWLSITVIVVGVVGIPILSMIFPPAFGATYINDMANFEFKSEAVARQFMALNDIEEVKPETNAETETAETNAGG